MNSKFILGVFLLSHVLAAQGEDLLEKYLDNPAKMPGEVLALVQIEVMETQKASEPASRQDGTLKLRMIDASSDTIPEHFDVPYFQPQGTGSRDWTWQGVIPAIGQLYLGFFHKEGKSWLVSGQGAMKHVANIDRQALNRAQKTFQRPYNSGPIGELVRNLSGGFGLWLSKEPFPALSFPKDASLETVVAKFLELTELKAGRVKDYSIIEKARVIIPPLPVEYDAVTIRSDLGLKVLLIRYESQSKLWWIRIFDVEVVKHIPGEQKEG